MKTVSKAWIVLIVLLMTACQSTPSQQTVPKSANKPVNPNTDSVSGKAQTAVKPKPKPTYRYIESTLFFDDEKASVSLRAAVHSPSVSNPSATVLPLVSGYQFQFRSVNDTAVPTGNVAIKSDGDMIVVEAGHAFIPSGKGVTFVLGLKDSRRVNAASDAILLFDYKNKLHQVIIHQHQLIEWHQERSN